MKRGKLFLCGLGHFPPQTTSLNVLHALGGCDLVFHPQGEPEVARTLDDYCPGVKRVPYRGPGVASGVAGRILGELGRGRVVGLATRGHPLLFGRGAGGLLKRCERSGVDCETFGAVSALGVVLARVKKTLGLDWDGVQAYDARSLAGVRGLDSGHPLVVSFESGGLGRSEAAGLARLLRRFYAPSHACRVFGPSYDEPAQDLPLENLAARLPGMRPGHILFLGGVEPE